jgi:HK97 family phage portal protein
MAVFSSLGELGDHLSSRSGSAPIVTHDAGMPISYAFSRAASVWDSQPAVRKVVEYIAKNLASIPVHVYERVSDTDRKRVTDHALNKTLGSFTHSTAYRFFFRLIVDWMLHDRWACMKVRQPDGSIRLERIPPKSFSFKVDYLERITAITIRKEDNSEEDFDPSRFVFDFGYSQAGGVSTSPMTTLSGLLDEVKEREEYRRSVWTNGARIPAVVEWDGSFKNEESLTRFKNSLGAFTRSGGQAGGVPVFENGMKLKSVDVMKPQDTNELEARKLTDIEVAAAYHIPPELVFAREANYASMDAHRQMLWSVTFGPLIVALEQALNAALVDELAADRKLYIELHVDAKLRGSFLEQAEAASSSTGRPWMTTNETRSRFNLPEITDPNVGADVPVTPLNVLIGGQASPRDSAPKSIQSKSGQTRSVKERAPESYEAKVEEVLSSFFRRQRASVLSKLGAKAASDFWDAERWDRELGDDLYRLALLVTENVGPATLEAAGFDGDIYSVDQTLAWLRGASDARAAMINEITKAQLDEALENPVDEDDTDAPERATPEGVFKLAEESRAKSAAATIVTTFSAFAVVEAAKQSKSPEVTKTWIVTSTNPRNSHKSMNGETVSIDDEFSNGARWPGDSVLDVDDRAGCRCEVQVNF